jgi:hypothetical protein
VVAEAVANAAPVDANRADGVTNAASGLAAVRLVPRDPGKSDRPKNRGVRSDPRHAHMVSDLRGVIDPREASARKVAARNGRDRNDREAKAVPPSGLRNARPLAPSRRAPRSGRLTKRMISEPGCSTPAALRSPFPQTAVSNTGSLHVSGPRRIGASQHTSAARMLTLRSARSAKKAMKSTIARKAASSDLLKRADVHLGAGAGGDVRVRDAKDRLDRWIGRDL